MTSEQISLFISVGLLVLGLLTALYVLQRVRAGQARRVAQPRPPVVAPTMAAEPDVVAAAPAETPSPFLPQPAGDADDLLRIKGIGPKLSARLAELGVFHFAQIAQWTPEQLALVDSQLGAFQGRPERDQWQSQAALFAAGDIKGYERVHGKLGPAA